MMHVLTAWLVLEFCSMDASSADSSMVKCIQMCWLATSAWLPGAGPGGDGLRLHCVVLLCCHRFCYNANSKDTGGLVGDDWQTLVWRKLTW
jgi:hypothetical protein